MRQLLRAHKLPTTAENYVGVEMEFLLPSDRLRDKLEDKLVSAKLEYNVNVGTDGSVEDPTFVPRYSAAGDMVNQRPLGVEIRILATQKELSKIVLKVCEIIKSVGGYVNNSCGLHVHLDMRNRDVDVAYNNLFFSQKLLYATQPKSRNGQYSKIMKRKIQKPTDRYYGINRMSYDRYRTIEVRMHEGSVDAMEILVWVGSLIKIVDFDKPIRQSVKDFNKFKVPKKVQEYLDERIKKYSVRKSNSKAS